ncbi:hypothetical protein [Acidisoma sp. 7E03]
MIETPTVFIVGAGASKEVGLPLGSELTEEIRRRLVVSESREAGVRTADPNIVRALNALSQGHPGAYIRAAQDISAAMPLAVSIDNFLHTHRSNKEIIQVGKMAIVSSILEKEKTSDLFVETSNSYNSIPFPQIKGTWFVRLWHALSTDLDVDNVDQIFSNVSFVVFNYDRCIEQFLYYSLNTYFKIGSSRAREILSKLRIIHPYGKIDDLFLISNQISFGESVDPHRLIQLSENIKTFTEHESESSEVEDIHSMISTAKKSYF